MSATPETLAARLEALEARIQRACLAAGRARTEVRLVAVSKTRSAEEVHAAYRLGLRDFGENYVQELCAKRESLAELSGLQWHFIGHLQRNKVREVLRGALPPVVHTVDSPRLAQELEARAAAAGLEVRVLAQVNVGGEEQKSGCAPGELGALLGALSGCAHLRVRGLMTVPPHTEDAAASRPFFDALVALRDRFGGAKILPELSMGMTQDLEHAVAAGATMLRVGTALFGERG